MTAPQPNAFAPLTCAPLNPGASFFQPPRQNPTRVSLHDPAIAVMTDLKKVRAITARPDEPMEAAHQRMIHRAVRLLLVIDDEEAIRGIVTANDILGEKPLRYLQQNPGARREDILVKNIMTPEERLDALNMRDVERATVGDIVATLQEKGRQHALAVDILEPAQTQIVRGIFSCTQIARQLGHDIQTPQVARSFADIEAQIVR